MAVRVNALTPGMFIAQHLSDVGGVDYVQATYNAYKEYLKSKGIVKIPCHQTMSKYFYLARKLNLIQFDHAEGAAYWDSLLDVPKVTARYQPLGRPRAPSPRHYYRIVDAQDERWIRLEASYRESLGLPVSIPMPRIPVITPAKPSPQKKKRKTKSKARPGVKPVPEKTGTEVAAPFEKRLRFLDEILQRFGNTYEANTALGNVEVVSAVEKELLAIAEDLLKAVRRKRGQVKERLDGLTDIVQNTINDIGLLRSSLSDWQSATLPARRQAAKTALDRAIEVLREDLTGDIQEE